VGIHRHKDVSCSSAGKEHAAGSCFFPCRQAGKAVAQQHPATPTRSCRAAMPKRPMSVYSDTACCKHDTARRWSDLRKAFAASTQLLAASCLLSSLMLQSASFMKVSPA
jgi:hypothetical protein